MKILYIMQGVSGSGKSTTAASLRRPIIYSTDDYWRGEGGAYVFDVEKLGEAHQWNQARVEAFMMVGGEEMIVDNTNISYWEARPYFVLAEKYGYAVQVIRCDPGLKECLRRNAERPEDRRIPEHLIRAKYTQMEDLWRMHSTVKSIVEGM